MIQNQSNNDEKILIFMALHVKMQILLFPELCQLCGFCHIKNQPSTHVFFIWMKKILWFVDSANSLLSRRRVILFFLSSSWLLYNLCPHIFHLLFHSLTDKSKEFLRSARHELSKFKEFLLLTLYHNKNLHDYFLTKTWYRIQLNLNRDIYRI